MVLTFESVDKILWCDHFVNMMFSISSIFVTTDNMFTVAIFRDSRPEIRALCIAEIGEWMKEYRYWCTHLPPPHFISYIKTKKVDAPVTSDFRSNAHLGFPPETRLLLQNSDNKPWAYVCPKGFF